MNEKKKKVSLLLLLLLLPLPLGEEEEREGDSSAALLLFENNVKSIFQKFGASCFLPFPLQVDENKEMALRQFR